MDIDDIIEQLRHVFLDIDWVKIYAKETQALDPAKFKKIIETMINENHITENYFAYLNETIPEDIKLSHLSEFTNLIYEMQERISDGEELDSSIIVKTMTNIERKIYETSYVDVQNEIKNHPNFIERDNIEIYNIIFNPKKQSNLSFEERENIKDVISAYLNNNEDSSCLYNIFELILQNKEYAKYIPYSHLCKIGLKDVFDYEVDEEEEIEFTKIFFEGIPCYYLSFTNDYISADDDFLVFIKQEKNLLNNKFNSLTKITDTIYRA